MSWTLTAPDLPLTGIDDGAMPDIRGWIADRFTGKPSASTCDE